MVIFTCEADFSAMMTCIYDAWAARLGHSNIRLELEPVLEPELFADYRHVDPDPEKAEKVSRSIRQKISPLAFRYVYAAAHSFRADRLDVIYRFLICGFHYGRQSTDLLGIPQVAALFELSRKVQNEAHYFREFTRFACIPPAVYYAVIEPKCDILTMLAPHFADRMPSESFLIADANRLVAAVHPADTEFYLTALTREEFLRMEEARQTADPYTALWKSFFQATAIEKRRNERCQRTMLSLWYRKNMPEFH